MNARLIRQVNTSRLFHALRQNPGSSQRDLARLTDLDKATVSTIVKQLESRKLIEKSEQANRGKVGRPETSLNISLAAGYLVGARLEPGTIRLILTYLNGEVVARHEESGKTDLDSSIALLAKGVGQLLEKNKSSVLEVKALGIGIPALIDHQGYLVFAPNLGWRDVAIGERLEQEFTVPVYLDNDTKAAALAEKLFGKAQDSQDFLFISGHSGVGGGVYLADRLYRGHSGLAGEIGHMTVNPEGPRCNCGNKGCLEMYVSEAAILKDLRSRGRHLNNVWEVKMKADQQDEVVLKVLEQSATYLGLALANLMNVLNPEQIIVGGNLAVIAPAMMPVVEQELSKRTLKKPLKDCQISLSLFGAESVPMGGIALALEGFLALPTWLRQHQVSTKE